VSVEPAMRCPECGSWDACCSFDTPQPTCSCARCALARCEAKDATIARLREALEAAAPFHCTCDPDLGVCETHAALADTQDSAAWLEAVKAQARSEEREACAIAARNYVHDERSSPTPAPPGRYVKRLREAVEAATTGVMFSWDLGENHGADIVTGEVSGRAMLQLIAIAEAAERAREALAMWPCYFCHGTGVRGGWIEETPDGERMVPKHTCATCRGTGSHPESTSTSASALAALDAALGVKP